MSQVKKFGQVGGKKVDEAKKRERDNEASKYGIKVCLDVHAW